MKIPVKLILLIAVAQFSLIAPANDETSSVQEPKTPETDTPWVDPFERGPLPTVSSSFDINSVDQKAKRFHHGSSIAFTGEVSSNFPEHITGLSVEFFQDTEMGRVRIFGLEAPIIKDRSFGLTALAPEDGWPVGRLTVRLEARGLPIVSKESVIQIVDPDRPEAEIVVTEEDSSAVDVQTARINLTIDPDRVREIPFGMPVCFCGRVKKPDKFKATALILKVRTNRKSICHSASVTLLEDGDELWFESYANITGRELRPGKLVAELHSLNGTALPEEFRAITLDVQDTSQEQ